MINCQSLLSQKQDDDHDEGGKFKQHSSRQNYQNHGKVYIFIVPLHSLKTDALLGTQWMPVARKVEVKSSFIKQQG